MENMGVGKIIHLREDRVAHLRIYFLPTMYLNHIIGFRVMEVVGVDTKRIS